MKNPLGRRLSFRRDDTLKAYWRARLELHHHDNYRGLQMSKLPEDLRTYEHVIWATQPACIVELGAGSTGGSALWFMDRLQALCGGGTVVSIDVVPPDDQKPGRNADDLGSTTRITGDLTDPAIVAEVTSLVGDRPAMVIEDSRHDYETTLEALRRYSPLVKKGHFFVVEDTIVDDKEMSIFGDHGVTPAVDQFLSEDRRFLRRADMDLYGVTMHSGGWLECIQ